MKRGCWIAFWAISAYVFASVGVTWGSKVASVLLAPVKLPPDISQYMGLMTELSRGLFPYIAGSVVFCLGFGAHLPGTRVVKHPKE